jgi:hypothetical protein
VGVIYGNISHLQSFGAKEVALKTVLASYVVRVYRFGKNQPHNLVGVVEEAGVKGKKAFTSLTELWALISSSRGVRSNSKGRRNTISQRK